MPFYELGEVQIQEDSRVKVYAVAERGRRHGMEDGYAIGMSLPCGTSLIGVFDGHGGDEAARFCTTNLFKMLLKDEAFGKGDFKESFRNVFIRMDEELSRRCGDSRAGTTAVVVLVQDARLFIAHAGDSYCSLFTKDGKMVHLTRDHSPSDPDEADRVFKAKCCIQDGRVSKPGFDTDGLALTRAFGDFEFKDNRKKAIEEQAVTCIPDVLEKDISSDYDYLVIASDGVPRKYLESRQAQVRKALLSNDMDALQRIVDLAGRDDRTLVLLKLKNIDDSTNCCERKVPPSNSKGGYNPSKEGHNTSTKEVCKRRKMEHHRSS